MVNGVTRSVNVTRAERARYTTPYRPAPPTLGDLRAFVAGCEGLPDDLQVSIMHSSLNEGGRRVTTLEVAHVLLLRDDETGEASDSAEPC